ncbi:MAG: DUF1848 domain-containing protein [Emergencia sp.]
MIINTGNRTDIPAFYSSWFYNRIREGFVLVRNPYNPQQVTRYLLEPETVDCITFCTKNPEPMLSQLSLLDDFRQYWAVTITPYGTDIEPAVPSAGEVMDAFCALSEKVGKENIAWRYDPIFLTETYTLDFHLRTFEKMAAQLAGFTDSCVISFLDLYDKTKKNFPQGKAVERENREVIGREFSQIAKAFDMILRPCGEGEVLAEYGADCTGCQSQAVLEKAVGLPLNVPASAMTRSACSCLLGSDIGAYNTCGHGCRYCYANYDDEVVRQNMSHHDPHSPFLIGGFLDGDMIKSADQESWIRRQISFDDFLLHRIT